MKFLCLVGNKELFNKKVDCFNMFYKKEFNKENPI